MNLKRAIIDTMGRDDLKAVCNDLETDGVDRRSREDMAGAVLRARRATAELLIEYLSEKQVKAVCDLVGVSSRGRRGALIERLLGGNGHPASSDAPRKTARDSRSRQGADGAEAHDEEEVTWMSADDAKSSSGSAAPGARPAPQANPATAAGLKVGATELVWPRKYDEHGRAAEPPRISLPFQVIEVIEEGRASREALAQGTLPLFGARPRGPEEEGWRNKLIWGDNLLVEGTLLDEFAGRIDLIYIDPPFSTGADFSFKTTIGDVGVSIVKEPSLLEQKAYRDTWGTGKEPPINHYLAMMYNRLVLMRDLLAPGGSIYVHCDWHVSSHLRLLLDEIFGPENFRAEIVWVRTSAHSDSSNYGQVHDSILFYTQSETFTWNSPKTKYEEWYIERYYRYKDDDGRRFMSGDLSAKGLSGGGYEYTWKGCKGLWRCPESRMAELDAENRIYYTSNGIPRIKRYLDEMEGRPIQSVWDDIQPVVSWSRETTGYATQKPEGLLQRIITASSNPGDLVADFFCGSGTTLAAAEKNGRRWIGSDLGRFAVHTSRKRMLDIRVRVGDSMDERGCKPFEVLNLGRYERKYWQGITFGNGDIREPDQAVLAAYVRFVLDLYNAQPLPGQHIHGKKGSGLVHVGAVDAPVTISQVEQALEEAKGRGARELHVLGWEWEMGLHDPLAKMAKTQHGVTLRLLNIPREVMDQRATEAGEVQFFDLAYLEVELKGGSGTKGSHRVKAMLKDFVIPNTDLIPEDVRKKVQKWSDYIDYWAVDWDFRDDTFINQWQTYRTPKDRKLALESAEHTYDAPGTYRPLVKVVDIFGNDTSHLLSWEAK